MPQPIRMPKLTPSMQEGRIVAWLKSTGDAVEEGEPLLQVETDKAVMDVESPQSGTLIAIRQEQGSRVPVNTIIAFVE